MITPARQRDAHLLSAWAAGIALLCLGIGMEGAGMPLLPVSELRLTDSKDDIVMVEEFTPAPAPADQSVTEPPPPEPEQDIEIPPLPEITPPLTPPEMVEITPLEEPPPPPMPEPVEKKPEPPKPKPETKPEPRPAPRPASKPSAPSSGTSSGSSPVAFSRAGSAGRFPDPTYPASARAAKAQGSVRLLVTVEASGIPSAVEVTSSSGSSALDNAARDTISRRWRWPAGAVRKFIVPIRFVLQ